VPQIKTEPADLTDWWKVFNDPVLDSLTETAYQQNLPLQIAGLRIMEARAQLGVAVGNQYPQLQQLSGSATAVEISDNAPNALAADKFFYDYQFGFDAAWELDFWGRFRRSWSLLIEKKTGKMSATVSDEGVGFVVFGACTRL
jgi:outer membrane protein TolC